MLYSEFGVTLETEAYDFDPGPGEAITNRFINSWTPSISPNWEAGVDVGYVVDDFYGYPSDEAIYLGEYTYTGGNIGGNTANAPSSVTQPSGGEVFDVEAVYMTNDEHAIYVAIVTSMPPPPGMPFLYGSTIVTGDIAFHTQEEVGVHSGEYAYGINLNHADTGIDTYGSDTTIGTELYKTNFDSLQSETDDWYPGTLDWAVQAGGEVTNFYGQSLPSGQFVGDYDDGVRVHYLDTGLLEGYSPSTTDPYASTWEIDVILPIALLPEYAGMEYGEKRDIGVQFVPGCRNDGNETDICLRLDFEYTDVPEPGTFMLAGFGLLALALLKRRRDAQKDEG